MNALGTNKNLSTSRIISIIAATCISLSCGTNYVYSAWGPQFADKLRLSSTEQNLIGLSANLGMYSLGIPIGIYVDKRGARVPLIFGGILLGLGYILLYYTYSRGSGYLPFICIFAFFTGCGGCASFSAAIKVSALNWPLNRGAATAFPAAAYGLSAFFFSSIAQLLFSGDTASLLLLLAVGTFGFVIIGSFFLKVLIPSENSVATNTSINCLDENQLQRMKTEESLSDSHQQALQNYDTGPTTSVGDEVSALIPKPPSIDFSMEYEYVYENASKETSQLVQGEGLELLKHVEFWQLFSLMGILAGISLMTINNIGNNLKALWRYLDESIDEDFIIRHESLQVSIISIASFLGRICSGIGSDFLVKKLKASRLWFLVFGSIIFLIAQLFALTIYNPRLLFLVSGPTGLAYGLLFGCYPSLVAEFFGVHALSQNFGAMILSPIISGNIFNLFYGKIYDQHSTVNRDGHRECTEGLFCYRNAYFLTFCACIIGLGVSLWSIWRTNRLQQQKRILISQNDYESEA